jgi:hypothetical protein
VRNKTYGSGVDSDTIILVIDLSPVDDDIRTGADVESISVVAKAASITGRAVNSHAGDGKSSAASDAHSLDRSIFDVKIRHCRVCKTVEGEKLL